MIRLASALLFGASLTFLAAPSEAAGKYNRKLNIGSPAPTFNLAGIDGRQHGLDDFKDRDVLVIVVTCNQCPVAQAYEERIADLAKKHATVGFVAINVSQGEEESLPKMKARSYAFPYLADPSQRIGRELGASVTPEFFVFDKQRKLVYTGALDDHFNAVKAKRHYLDDALRAVSKAQTPEVRETRPYGCGVSYRGAQAEKE